MFSPSCPVLIRGLSGAYQYRRVKINNEERYHDKPDKGPESHVVESCHYGLMGAGEGEALFDQAWQEYEDIESWAPPQHYYE